MKKVKQFIGWVKEKFSKVKKFDILNDDIDMGIYFVEGLKKVVNNPLLQALVVLTPTTIDDKVRMAIIKAIDYILLMSPTFRVCVMKKRLEDKLKCAVEHLGSLKKTDRHESYLSIASLPKNSSSAFNSSTVQAMVQNRYDELKECGLLI